MTNSKVLILTSGYSTTGVGEQFIESMVSQLPHDQLRRYSLVGQQESIASNHYGYNTTVKVVNNTNYPVLSVLNYWSFKLSKLKSLVEELVQVINKEKITVVWVFLNNFKMIQIAEKLLMQNIKLIAHVWDTPEYLNKKYYLDFITKKDLLKCFTRVMEGAAHVITVSDSMGNIYNQRYSSTSTTMVFSPPKEAWIEHRANGNDTRQPNVKIVFAGSLYAYKEWNSFLDAVEKHNLSAENKIEVLCVGNVSRWTKKRTWVRYEQLKPIQEAAEIVNSADIAYLPYWMDRSHSLFVKTAFPGKMSFYVAAGTPVFFHGPKHSTPTWFLEKYGVGLSCHSMEAKTIIDTIFKILDDNFLNNYALSRTSAKNDLFHSGKSAKQFLEILDSI